MATLDAALLTPDLVEQYRRLIYDPPFAGIGQRPLDTTPQTSEAPFAGAGRTNISSEQDKEAKRYREAAAHTPAKHHRVKQHEQYVNTRDGFRLSQIETLMRRESPSSYTYRELAAEAAKIIIRHLDEQR